MGEQRSAWKAAKAKWEKCKVKDAKGKLVLDPTKTFGSSDFGPLLDELEAAEAAFKKSDPASPKHRGLVENFEISLKKTARVHAKYTKLADDAIKQLKAADPKFKFQDITVDGTLIAIGLYLSKAIDKWKKAEKALPKA